MNRFGFQWPENLECKNFPESGLCVGENRSSSETPIPTTPYDSDVGDPRDNGVTPRGGGDFPLDCPRQYQVESSLGYKLRIGDQVVDNCGMPCDGKDALFDASSYPHIGHADSC